MEDLLPRAQHRAALGDGDGDRGTERGRLQVRVPVAVVPGKPTSAYRVELLMPRVEDIQDGGDVLVKGLRVGLDGTVNTGLYGAAPLVKTFCPWDMRASGW